MERLKTDYLVVGAGAMGLAFIDTLLDETDADIILVDSHAKPGGHWNDAYPFVTLHQPSAFYGVASRELGRRGRDQLGWNKGLADLATGAEILAYFDALMRERWLPTGRLRYFPLCDYQGDGKFVHRLTGMEYHADHTRWVDATLLKTSVPATHTPNFTVDPDAVFIPLNDLPKLTEPAEHFTVIGGGKTGIDAILWLLDIGVPHADISWVLSRDGWLLDRENTQNHPDFWHQAIGTQANMFKSIAESTSQDDMFDRLEDCGYFLRLDPDVRPRMFHGATISKAELAELRKLPNIIRKGRVTHIGKTELGLTEGSLPIRPGTVHVDCSASAIKDYVMRPVFEPGRINPQTVRAYQPVFSGSFIAHIEASDRTMAEKNALCGVVPLPDALDDFVRMTAANMMNQALWGQDKALRKWMAGNRLDGFSGLVSGVAEHEADKIAILKSLRANAMPAMMKLQKYLAN